MGLPAPSQLFTDTPVVFPTSQGNRLASFPLCSGESPDVLLSFLRYQASGEWGEALRYCRVRAQVQALSAGIVVEQEGAAHYHLAGMKVLAPRLVVPVPLMIPVCCLLQLCVWGV